MADTLEILIKARDELSANVGKMDASLQAFSRSLGSVKNVAVGVTASLAAVGTAVFAITKTAAEFGDQLLQKTLMQLLVKSSS